MKTLALFVRRDGAGFAYSLASDQDAETRFAKDRYTTPGEPFPGARALEAWKLVDLWVMPSTCRTVRDAMKIVGAA